MEIKLYSQEGKETWVIELKDSVFGIEPNENLIHRALVYQLANARTNVAHTKTRGERRGSTRKIYRQKGTGRARMGSNRSPIRKKGWVAFGPRNNRNFTISMNKKERRLALFSVLSSKAKNNQIIVVDDIKLKEVKTKLMDWVFKSLPFEKTALFAINKQREDLHKATRNLDYVKDIQVDYLNIKDLLKYNTLILLKDSLEDINSRA